jgi:8-amino-3,8-dideoxy-alpha-D-manno-octulosonate transaminase
MELQGAIGLAQLAKLDGIVAAQQRNKKAMKALVAKLPGVTFRTILDEQGDNASFLAFFLPDKAKAQKVKKALAENGAGAICFAENTWHYYPKWEHLLAGATLAKSGWPFAEPGGKKRVVYDAQVLPQSAAIMDRLLVYPVPVKEVSQERLAQIGAAIEKAVAALS